MKGNDVWQVLLYISAPTDKTYSLNTDSKSYRSTLKPSCTVDTQKSYNSETTSQGAAILSSIGSGFLPSLKESSKFWKLNKSYNPKMQSAEINKYRNGWKKAIKQTISDTANK